MARSKAQCQRIHAKRRAYEREGLMLNREDLRRLVQQISTRRCEACGASVIACDCLGFELSPSSLFAWSMTGSARRS